MIGGASGSITGGKLKSREPRGATRSRGGNRLPFGDQESVSRDAQRGVVVEASPTSPFEVSKPELLFQLLIIALDAPAQLGQIDQAFEGDVCGQRREPIFGRLLLAFGPFDQQPFLATQLATTGGAHTDARQARGQSTRSALAPADRAPGALRHVERKRFDRDRLLLALT